MTRIPLAPLALGLAGLLPFVWSAATNALPGLASAAGAFLPPMFIGAYVGLTYGTVILSFMSGVLWGFATRAEGDGAWVGYVLSIIPALWVFFMVTDASPTSIFYLGVGFVAVLGLDLSFARQGLTPTWWMALRSLLTVIVLACLTSLLLI